MCMCVLFSVDQICSGWSMYAMLLSVLLDFFINIQKEIYCVVCNGMYGL